MMTITNHNNVTDKMMTEQLQSRSLPTRHTVHAELIQLLKFIAVATASSAITYTCFVLFNVPQHIQHTANQVIAKYRQFRQTRWPQTKTIELLPHGQGLNEQDSIEAPVAQDIELISLDISTNALSGPHAVAEPVTSLVSKSTKILSPLIPDRINVNPLNIVLPMQDSMVIEADQKPDIILDVASVPNNEVLIPQAHVVPTPKPRARQNKQIVDRPIAKHKAIETIQDEHYTHFPPTSRSPVPNIEYNQKRAESKAHALQAPKQSLISPSSKPLTRTQSMNALTSTPGMRRGSSSLVRHNSMPFTRRAPGGGRSIYATNVSRYNNLDALPHAIYTRTTKNIKEGSLMMPKGAIRCDSAIKNIAQLRGLTVGAQETLLKQIQACDNKLNEYITFDLPQSVLTTEESLILAVKKLITFRALGGSLLLA